MFAYILLAILALSLFLSNRAKDEKQNATREIQEASSHEEATSIRSKTKGHLERRTKVSITLSIICVFVFLIGALVVYHSLDTAVKEMAGKAPENDYVAAFVFLFLVVVLIAAVVLYNKGYYDFLTGHIQTVTYEDFIQQNRQSPFVLYLRSFNEDFYTEKRGFKKQMKEGFSEYRFSRELKKHGIDCYAIGITRELDSPYGANRIYCDFDDWKSQVADMIRRATAVFIVMDARDSCIWEVEVCMSEPIEEKTVFYFKDPERFNLVSKQISLPEISDTQSFPCSLFHGCYSNAASGNKSMMYTTIIEEMILPSVQQG